MNTIENINIDNIDILNKIKNNKMLVIGVVSFIVLLLIIIIISITFFKKELYLKNGFEINKINSFSSSVTPNDNIVPPKFENDFTISFWIYIDSFYENYLFWRHIFHKGSSIDNLLSYQYWYNIETEIPQQALGLWMHPDKNNLRIAVSTIIESLHENSEHPDYENAYKSYNKNVYKESLEICDINDIPSKTQVHFILCLEGQTLSIFRDGKLHKTCGLNGKPIINVGDMYFNYQKTYSGKLYNFTYFPFKATKKVIKKLYEKKPIIN